MSSEIKPCPYCGCKGRFRTERSGEDCMDSWVEYECGAKGPEWEGSFGMPEAAIAAANQRSSHLSAPVESGERDRDHRAMENWRLRRSMDTNAPEKWALDGPLASDIIGRLNSKALMLWTKKELKQLAINALEYIVSTDAILATEGEGKPPEPRKDEGSDEVDPLKRSR